MLKINNEKDIDTSNMQLQVVKKSNFMERFFAKIKSFFSKKRYATIEINELKNELKEEANRVEDNRSLNNEYVKNKLDIEQNQNQIENDINDNDIISLIGNIKSEKISIDQLSNEQLDLLNNHYDKINTELSTEIKINRRKLQKINIKLDCHKEEIHKLRNELMDIRTT